jgi:hypothetical protein
MPPKSAKGSKPPVAADNATSEKKKPSPVEKKAPIWFKMGKQRVKFNAIARSLSDNLRLIYGEDFSISHFEKALIELKGQTALQEKVEIGNGLLEMHNEYVVQKARMIEEQRLFSSSFQTKPVVAEIITSVNDLFRSPATPPTTYVVEEKAETSSEPAAPENPVTPYQGSSFVPKSGTKTGTKVGRL